MRKEREKIAETKKARTQGRHLVLEFGGVRWRQARASITKESNAPETRIAGAYSACVADIKRGGNAR